MRHLDEGTIHAWIDGALDEAQSRELEAHLKTCAECSAAVAEARGLVAASSRILNALDDVPAGVVPKGTAAPALAQNRPRRIAPWVPALAAAGLVVAIGLSQIMPANRGATESASNDSAALGAQVLKREVADSTAVAPSPVAAQTQVAGPQERRAAPAPAPLRQSRAADLADAAASRDGGRAAVGSAAGGAADQRLAAAPASPPPPPATAEAAAAETKMLKSAEPAPVAVAPDRADRMTADSLTILPGCYRIEGPVEREEVRVGNVAGAVSRAATNARTRQPAQGAAAPSAAAFDARAVTVPRAGEIIRLDTARTSLGMRVRGAQSDSVIGWWTRFGPDTASVRLLPGVALTMTARNRVACPER